MTRSNALAVVLLLLGLAAGAVRWAETTRVLPGDRAQFSVLHAVDWDPAARRLRRTGDDPYVWLALPGAGPVKAVTFEFAGQPAHGPTKFYVYQSSAYLLDVELDDSHVVLGRVEPGADSYAIHWILDDSQIVRLDLPDDLAAPVEVRSVTVTTTFHGAWTATLMWLLLAAAGGAWLVPRLGTALRRRPWLEPAIVVALIGLKVGLASDLHLAVLPEARHDDLLFIRQAQSILEGHWLGPFDEITLAKGPVYPLFLAAVSLSGDSLLFTETLLHALAVVLLVRALRPLVGSPTARLALLVLLLFDPHTLSGAAMGRVLRSGLQPALTLLTLAGFIGLATRIRCTGWRPMGWSLLAGISLVLFWHCREEGIWLLPSVAVLLAVTAVSAWPSPTGRVRRLGWVVLPALLFYGSSEALRAVNRHAYGAPVTVDVRDGAFPSAYGALLRITPDRFEARVPVSRASRLRAYAASPAFAELQPFLEGAIGRQWAEISQGAEPDPATQGEIQGGWFQWALRDAAAAAGHYRTAAEADAYWRRVAREVNAAAEAGQLAAGKPRTGFLPPWQAARGAQLVRGLKESCAVIATWSDFSLQFPPRPVPAGLDAAVRAVTHEPVAANLNPPTVRATTRQVIANIYGWAGWILTAPALGLALLALSVRGRRTGLERSAVLVALGGGVLALALVVALVDATSFHATHAMYLAPATPLLLALWVLGPLWWRGGPAAGRGTRACAGSDFPVASRPSP